MIRDTEDVVALRQIAELIFEGTVMLTPEWGNAVGKAANALSDALTDRQSLSGGRLERDNRRSRKA